MKRNLIILIVLLCTVKLAVHLVGNQNYGFHRDELLHLSVSEHLATGYMEFPPLIAFIGKIATTIFDHSLSGIRFFATLAGIGILILCCLMAKEMGATIRGVLIAGVAVLSFLPFYRNHTLFQPVAFDQFFWTLGFYWIVLFINRARNKYLVFAGITIGFGLLNKYTFVIWLASVAIALLFYDRASVFKNKYLYIACGIALIMVLPNVIWQIQNDFPALLHQQRLREVQLEKINPLEFGLAQLEFPFTFLLTLVGLYGVFFYDALKKFRALGIAFITALALMWVFNAKAYYFFAAYPVMFAAGAAMIEKLFQKRPALSYAIPFILFLPIIYFIPALTPVLPIERFVEYKKIQPDEDGRYILSGDYADMFGWVEQVRLVDSVYNSLPAVERDSAIIWAENYGEAGALKFLGDAFGLPDPISVHASFWTFGPPPSEYSACVTIGLEKETLDRVFEEVTLVKMIKHKYAIDEENNIPLYICRKPRINLKAMWPEFKKYIFS